MSALTMAEKLSALGSLIQHLPRQTDMSDSNYSYAVSSMLVIMYPQASNYQRAACSIVLDYVFPQWRDHLSVAAVGAIADRGSGTRPVAGRRP